MTCIVGIAKEGKVYVGADSCSSDSHIKFLHKRPKVFKKGDLLIGFTSSWRMGQLLEHEWSLPTKKESQNDYDYLIKECVPSIQRLFCDHKFGKEKDGEKSGGTFLIGLNGKIFCIQDDFSLQEPVDGFYAVGSGEQWALGSLYSTQHLKDTERRIELAIEAAEHYCCTVSGPVFIKSE